ncbi:hypothetical protein SCP_1600300 [Sparassis crispa]|uniref:Uncharacterized protein n=1 Tax=Sparassis crispa TaxID=139825 RepID=A0A401H4R6_9APHY|nr:hypothetical protein SCP_1600300 [Sparassis crispa]GBE89369.1 hypothetical protein SCP_1600300 [Sparassis crispa]
MSTSWVLDGDSPTYLQSSPGWDQQATNSPRPPALPPSSPPVPPSSHAPRPPRTRAPRRCAGQSCDALSFMSEAGGDDGGDRPCMYV